MFKDMPERRGNVSQKSADISARYITDALDNAGNTVSDVVGDDLLDSFGNAMIGIVVGGFKRQAKEEVTEQERHQSFYSGLSSSNWEGSNWDSSWD